MSALAALAVASPFAYVAVSELTAGTDSAPQHREFVRAAVMTDLPGELMSALSQGLSQFGVNLPPIPSLTGSTGPALSSPGLSPGLASPDLTSPGLTAPGAAAGPGFGAPGAFPSATTPGLTAPGLTNPSLTSPGGLDPSLSSPVGTGLTDPSGAPLGLDPGADGTYPILGDPSLGAGQPSGGLVSDVMSAAQQMGVGQVIDLLKGMVMPSISQAAQNAAPAAAAAPPVPGA